MFNFRDQMWLPRGNTCRKIIGTQSHQPVMTDEGLSVITTTSRTSSEISWWPISSAFDLNDMRVHTTFTEIKPRVISISDLSICRPQVHPHCSQQLAFFFLLFAVYTISSCKLSLLLGTHVFWSIQQQFLVLNTHKYDSFAVFKYIN